MFDINKVKIGDYFETNEGYIGEIVYVSRIFPCNIYISVPECYQDEWCFTQEELAKAWKNGDFKQIGTYIFEDKTIEPLEWGKYEPTGDIWDCVRVANDKPPTTKQITDKINEIINWINRHSEGDR